MPNLPCANAGIRHKSPSHCQADFIIALWLPVYAARETPLPISNSRARMAETDDMDVLKDPAMLKRLNQLNSLSEPDRNVILYAIDGLIRDAKNRKANAL